MKPLYKQILSDKDSKSFLPESFERDNELLNAIELFNAGQKENIESIKGLFEQLSEYEADHIYVKDIFLSEISNELFSEWGYIKGRLEDKYDEAYTGKKKANTEKEKNTSKTKEAIHFQSLMLFLKTMLLLLILAVNS